MEQLKAAIGAKRFVTETELEEIKAARGLTVDDGTITADKPLAEILAERKKAKQEAFEAQWKQMKTGKNRPLEADELEFLDTVAQQQAAQLAAAMRQEQEALEAYRAAVAAAAEVKTAASAGGGGENANVQAGSEPGSSSSNSQAKPVLGRSGSGGRAGQQGQKALISTLKPIVKVRHKGAGGNAADSANNEQQQQQPPGSAAAQLVSSGPASKRQKLEDGAAEGQPQMAGLGLTGLLGGYGSGSDDSD
eukprot:GHRR01021858.1.p1 GENE.GHRR01021858.1~~GHRR01021858.1.p1  ORF type:complete len:249 (+),score=137.12 GHRR01021858.1:691-1437(+)